MKIKEAIEILTAEAKYDDDRFNPDLNKAIKLGIEALKRLGLSRKDFGYIDPSLLPGETE